MTDTERATPSSAADPDAAGSGRGHDGHGHSHGTRPHKQEKDEASTEVIEVAPGIRRMQLPIDFTGLGHVNCYALEDERGVALVDPGLPGEASWKSLMARLDTAEIPLARIHSVIVTHSHPDHFGNAGMLARETGADIVTFERFRTFFDPSDVDEELAPAGADGESHRGEAQPEETVETDPALPKVPLVRTSPWGGTPLGPPPERLEEMRARASEVFRWLVVPKPSKRLGDLDRVTLAGREWVALFTPGHTDDHLCLYDEEEGVLLAGDQVLPTITPHVSGYLTPDSLHQYTDSLDRLAGLPDVRRVLPAHGHPFVDLARRVDEIKLHHDERLDELVQIAAERDWTSVMDLSQQLFAPRSWGSMAEDETYAHLEHLRLRGRAERREEAGVLLYRLA